MAEQVDSTSTQSAMQLSGASGVALSPVPPVPPSTASLTRRFLELIRFSHTVFALPFAALACAWALRLPFQATELTAWRLALRLLGVLLCMLTARSAAMAFNRLVDAEIDARNPRTQARHLPAGLLSKTQVWGFFAGNVVAFLAACGLFWPNWLPLAASLPVLLWICGYSFAKRFTAAAHVWLGMALALSPICAWVALRGEEILVSPGDVLPACGLALAIAFWVAGFDIIYACQDADFDRRSGLSSIPARFGTAVALRIAAALHLSMLCVLGLLPLLFPQLSLGWLTGAGIVVVAGLIVRQHMLVRPHDLRRVNVAFFNINAIISFGLSAVAAVDAWLP